MITIPKWGKVLGSIPLQPSIHQSKSVNRSRAPPCSVQQVNAVMTASPTSHNESDASYCKQPGGGVIQEGKEAGATPATVRQNQRAGTSSGYKAQAKRDGIPYKYVTYSATHICKFLRLARIFLKLQLMPQGNFIYSSQAARAIPSGRSYLALNCCGIRHVAFRETSPWGR